MKRSDPNHLKRLSQRFKRIFKSRNGRSSESEHRQELSSGTVFSTQETPHHSQSPRSLSPASSPNANLTSNDDGHADDAHEANQADQANEANEVSEANEANAVSEANEANETNETNEANDANDANDANEMNDERPAKANGLWKEAYERLCQDERNAKLIKAYEDAILLEGGTNESGLPDGSDISTHLQEMIQVKFRELKNSQTKFHFGEREIIVKDQVRRAIDLALSVQNLVTTAVSSEPHAALAWAGVLILMGPITRTVTQDEKAEDGFEEITEILARYKFREKQWPEIFAASQTSVKRSGGSDQAVDLHGSIRNQTIAMYENILEYELRLTRHYLRPSLFRTLGNLVWPEDWQVMHQAIVDIDNTVCRGLRDIKHGAIVRIDGHMEELLKQVKTFQNHQAQLMEGVSTIKNNQLISSLPIAHEARFESAKNKESDQCFEETQIEILRQIRAWIVSPEQAHMFWLPGMAGIGKSTIARTIAAQCRDSNGLPDNVSLGASFFFDEKQNSQKNAALLFPTLSRSLATCLPNLEAEIIKSIGNDRDIADAPLSDQWNRLILNPIANLEKQNPLLPLTMVVVIDALDECKPRRHDNDVQTIVNLIANAHTLKLIRLKVLFTSRPEANIQSTFKSQPATRLRIQEVHKVQPNFGSGHVEDSDDITRWLRHQLRLIADKYKFDELDWPREERFRQLVEKTDGLWQYASTACKFIDDWNLDDGEMVNTRLNLLLQKGGDIENRPPEHNLDEIYGRILNNHVAGFVPFEKASAIGRFRITVGAIVVLCQQISITALSNLLSKKKDEVQQPLARLGSLIHLGDGKGSPIRLAHLSFSEYLLDKDRCQDEAFRISKEAKHGELLGHCLDTLSGNLKRDIYQFGSHSMLRKDIDPKAVSQRLPAHVQYACLYWVEHLLSSDSHPLDDGQVHCFLKDHLLNWIEALSLMDKVSDGMHAVVMLSGYLMDLPHDGRNELRSFVYDVKRFMLHCRSTIEMAPLQVYRSALIYCPYESMVRKQYGHLISEWSTLGSMDANWSPLLQTLQHNGKCDKSDVALSSDGKLVASSTGSVWETSTGTLLKRFDTNGKGHAVAFSLNENHVIILCGVGEIEVWDVPTGSLVRKIEHEEPLDMPRIFMVRWSLTPDKSRAAYFLENGTILVSDIRQGRVSSFKGPLERYSELALSPHGGYLAITGPSNRLQVYNTDSGGLVHDFTGDLVGQEVYHMAFSYDGCFVAAADLYNIRIWSMETFNAVSNIYDDDLYVDSIAFSPIGTFLCVSSKREGVVSWWDWASETIVRSIKSDYRYAVRTEFSQDGRLCAMLPFDLYDFDPVPPNQIQIWNPGSGECPKFLDGHSKPAVSVSFSRNASLLASTSDDGTVRLWDPMGHAGSQRPVDIDLETFTRLYISPNHQHVVASNRHNVSLWNCGTDRCLEHVQTHPCMDMAYSPNGIMYAYESAGTLSVRSTDGGKEIHALSPRTRHFRSKESQLAFSADSQFLVHGDFGRDGYVKADGRGLIEIWEASSGTSRGLLDLENHRCSALAFSIDANYVAGVVYSDDTGTMTDFSLAGFPSQSAIFIWNISNGNGDINAALSSIPTVDQIVTWDEPKIIDLAWSPDGRVLASLNFFGEIRLWEVSTRSPMAPLVDQGDFPDRPRFEFIVFSPDGRYLAALCSKGPIALWDMSKTELIGTREIGGERHSVRFSDDGRTIETSMGRIDIESFYPEPRRASHSDFAVEDNWVLFGQEKAILLPHDYQPTCLVVAGDVLVMGHESGRISYLRRN